MKKLSRKELIELLQEFFDLEWQVEPTWSPGEERKKILDKVERALEAEKNE